MIFLQEKMCVGSQAMNIVARIFLGWEYCAVDVFGHLGGLLTACNPRSFVLRPM